MNISQTIFRAYDIRGIAGEDLTVDTVKIIGQAYGSMALEQGEDIVFIGRDGRLSGPELIKALAEGIQASGCDVINIGMVPTPLLYFATKILNSSTGIMLTGSHNPPEYNGLKMVLKGMPVAGESIQLIYHRIVNNKLLTGAGNYRETDIHAAYLERIQSDIHLKKPLKIVVDAGNGIAGKIGVTLYKRLGCEVTELYCDVDGHFPNHPADPSDPENLEELIKQVKKTGADVGIAFDGDGDRLGVVTNEGEIIWPDRTLMLFASDVLSRNKGADVIFDVKCTKFLADVIMAYGGHPVMSKTGHSFIKEKLHEDKNALLAGEMSGHFFFKERWYGFDDAIYSGARLLEIISKADKSVHEIFKSFPDSINTPEIKLPISEDKKFVFMGKFAREAYFPNAKVITIDGLRVEFENGFGLIRPSNTTPYLILRFEADSNEELSRIQELFKEQLLKVDNTLELPF